MIKKIKIRNFRNFETSEFFFSEKENAIIGENGKGKTNILEAIALFSGINFGKIEFDNLVNKNENIFYIEIELTNDEKLSISYDKISKTKKYFVNGKLSSKKKISNNADKVVFFSPIIMNMMYLSPNLRRDFLDETLSKTFPEYKKLQSEYKKILISRNKLLKNIRENKSEKTEIDFWDKQFILKATQIYNYRFGIIDFLKVNTENFTTYFNDKIKKFSFKYKTKIKLQEVDKSKKIKEIQNQISKYLKENIDRDIILSTTSIGPHIDDFEIEVDNIPLIEFASRGEVKSTIIGLKLLEINFIEKFTDKKPILLIDDLLSELDNKHKELLLKNIKGYQVFITSIREDYDNIGNTIKL